MEIPQLLAARAQQMGDAGHFDHGSMAPVPSPCISVCRMTPDRSHCVGCFRTLDEIRMWARADAGLRRVIWAAVLQRAGVATPAQA
ncbi:MAG: DUF1289 domain-containing protein [Comamonadaceae bacterium]|nr:MAG: DUF1289 domain-containing protein [Comamonadaceae bacterium]